MNAMEAIYKAMDAYYDITGLHSYFVQDESDIISASAKEKNFFCKCLKTSTRALKHCDDCTVENYTQALPSMKVQTSSCHAGILKWSVPVDVNGLTGVIVSEGVISKQQIKESDDWIGYLAEKYNVSRTILLENYHQIKEMTEEQVNCSIQLLEDILSYYASVVSED